MGENPKEINTTIKKEVITVLKKNMIKINSTVIGALESSYS